MNKKFGLKFNKKEYTPEEQQRQNIIKGIVYVGLAVMVIVFFRLSGSEINLNQGVNNNGNNNENNTKDVVLELLEPLKENNYEVNIDLTVDSDIVNIVKRMQDPDNEIFYINYRGVENAYVRKNNNYYVLNVDNTITETTEYQKLFDYDETFLNPSSLILLLETYNEDYIDLQEEKYKIRRYKISLKDTLEIYNEIHGTNEFTSLDQEISIDIRYNEEVEGLYIDLTHYNNYILSKNYSKVTHDITFVTIGNVDLSGVMDNIE